MSDAMDTSKILDKVKKLLALGESPNQQEAESAIAKAHDLLKQYNLELSDIEVENADVVDETYMESGRTSGWKVQLMLAVAKANYAEMYSSLKRKRGDIRDTMISTFRFVGKPQNVAVTKAMMDYLLSAIERLASRLSGTGKSTIESYKAGVAEAIILRLRESRKKDMTSSTESMALVIREDKDIKDYFDAMKDLVTKKAKPAQRSNWDAFARGKLDGKTIALNDQIGSKTNEKVALGGY